MRNFFHALPLQNIRETNEGGFSSLALAELGTTMGEEHRAGPSPLVNLDPNHPGWPTIGWQKTNLRLRERIPALAKARASSQSLAIVGQEVVGRPAPKSGLVLI